MSRPLRVAVDIGPAVHQRAGLSRYTTQLVSALQSTCADAVKLRTVYNRHSGHAPPPQLSSLPTVSPSMGQYLWRLSILASQVARVDYWPLRDELVEVDVFHATEHLLPRVSCTSVLTVHDLIFEHHPEHHTRLNRLFLRTAMPLFVRTADRIIAVSRHTARDVAERYRLPAAKINVVYEGVGSQFRPQSPATIADVQARYSPDRPYLLMVGTLEPRKNHVLALKVLARLRAQGYPHRLIIGGGDGWMFDPVRRLVDDLDLVGDVAFAGYIPDADLPGLYAATDCLLLPSLYEGFGLPVLEAMACGAPVIASDVSSLPEVAGTVAPLLPPHDVEAWVAALRRLLDGPDMADARRAQGIAHASRFTWTAAARATAEVYHAAFN